jgi:hypothetical protein
MASRKISRSGSSSLPRFDVSRIAFDEQDEDLDRGLHALKGLEQVGVYFNLLGPWLQTQFNHVLRESQHASSSSLSVGTPESRWVIARPMALAFMKKQIEHMYVLASDVDDGSTPSEAFVDCRVGEFNDVLIEFYTTHHILPADQSSFRNKIAHWLNSNKVNWKNSMITVCIRLRLECNALVDGEIDALTGAHVPDPDDRVPIAEQDEDAFDKAARAHMRRLVGKEFKFWDFKPSTLSRVHTLQPSASRACHAHTHLITPSCPASAPIWPRILFPSRCRSG